MPICKRGARVALNKIHTSHVGQAVRSWRLVSQIIWRHGARRGQSMWDVQIAVGVLYKGRKIFNKAPCNGIQDLRVPLPKYQSIIIQA